MSHIHSTSLDNIIWIPDTSIADSQDVKQFDNAVRTEINLKTGKVYLSRRYLLILITKHFNFSEYKKIIYQNAMVAY